MTNENINFLKIRIVLVLSIITSLFWLMSWVINVYDYPALGAFFELMWLPMIALIFGLPLVALIFIFKKSKPVSQYVWSLVILIGTILFLTFKSRAQSIFLIYCIPSS